MKVTLVLPVASLYRAAANELRWRFPPYTLMHLAALAPADVDVRIVDENVEPLDFDAPTDLVGITTLTATAHRAYEIADTYRRKAVPVVLGGMHASAVPEEAQAHCDALVVGEADLTWPVLLADARRRRLQPRYVCQEWHSLRRLPALPRHLVARNRHRYVTTNVIQATRGCPFKCEFCAITAFQGARVRCRPVGEVMEEVNRFAGRLLIFMDDNIIGVKPYARELFSALRGRGLRWAANATINIAADGTLLRLAAESGCVGLFIGFETTSANALRAAGKQVNTSVDYHEAVRTIHARGISILGSFVFGLDGDDPGSFERALHFVQRARLDAVYYNIAFPYPGTELFARLRRQRRIVDYNWSHYLLDNVCFLPDQMSPAELAEGVRWIYRSTATLPFLADRMLRGLVRSRSTTAPLLILGQGLGLRRIARQLAEQRARRHAVVHELPYQVGFPVELEHPSRKGATLAR